MRLHCLGGFFLSVMLACAPNSVTLDAGPPVPGPCGAVPGTLDAPILTWNQGGQDNQPGKLVVFNRDGSRRPAQVLPGTSVGVQAWFPASERALVNVGAETLLWDTVAGSGVALPAPPADASAAVVPDQMGTWALRFIRAEAGVQQDRVDVIQLQAAGGPALVRSVMLPRLQGFQPSVQWLDADTVVFQTGTYAPEPGRQVVRWNVTGEEVETLWNVPDSMTLLTTSLDVSHSILLATERTAAFDPATATSALTAAVTHVLQVPGGTELAQAPGMSLVSRDANGQPGTHWVRAVADQGVFVGEAGSVAPGTLLPDTALTDIPVAVGSHVYIPMARAQPPVLKVVPMDGSGPGWTVELHPSTSFMWSEEFRAQAIPYVEVAWASSTGAGVRLNVVWSHSDVGILGPGIFARPDCLLEDLGEYSHGPDFTRFQLEPLRWELMHVKEDGSLIQVASGDAGDAPMFLTPAGKLY